MYCVLYQVVKLIGQGCLAYIVSLVDSSEKAQETTFVPVVSEFSNVFPEELPGVPLPREAEFTIDVVVGFEPISRAPYKMEPVEL